jgi:hypothetical protein
MTPNHKFGAILRPAPSPLVLIEIDPVYVDGYGYGATSTYAKDYSSSTATIQEFMGAIGYDRVYSVDTKVQIYWFDST